MMTGAKLELLITVALIVGVGVLVTNGWLAKEWAGIAIGALGGSGVRATVASTIVAPKAVDVPVEPPKP